MDSHPTHSNPTQDNPLTPHSHPTHPTSMQIQWMQQTDEAWPLQQEVEGEVDAAYRCASEPKLAHIIECWHVYVGKGDGRRNSQQPSEATNGSIIRLAAVALHTV